MKSQFPKFSQPELKHNSAGVANMLSNQIFFLFLVVINDLTRLFIIKLRVCYHEMLEFDWSV